MGYTREEHFKISDEIFDEIGIIRDKYEKKYPKLDFETGCEDNHDEKTTKLEIEITFPK